MRKSILFLMLIISLGSFAQKERINAMFFMDGKLVDVDNAYFSYKDSEGREVFTPFRSIYGEITLDKKSYEEIIKLESGFTEHCGNTGRPIDSLFINFEITECQGLCRYKYRELIPAIFVYKGITGVLIIRITNLNRKKTKYDIRYTAGIWHDPWGKKEKRVIFEPEKDFSKRKCKQCSNKPN